MSNADPTSITSNMIALMIEMTNVELPGSIHGTDTARNANRTTLATKNARRTSVNRDTFPSNDGTTFRRRPDRTVERASARDRSRLVVETACSW